MSQDWMLLTAADVELAQLAAAAERVSPRLRVRPDSSRRFLVLADEEEVPLVWVSPTRPVHDASSSTARLLPPGSPVRSWWTEVVVPLARGSLDPHQGTALPLLLAELAEQTGGSTVRLSPADDGGSGTIVRSADPLPGDDPCDLTTDRTGILLQPRPVVGLGPWLTASLLWARDHDRGLVLLTPASTRLTPAVERLVRRRELGWVADDGAVQRDGRTGRVVRWDGREFVPDDAVGPPATPARPADPAWQLLVEADTVHDSASGLVVGRFAERVAALLGAGPITGQGLLEPVEAPWDPFRLTREARRTSPSSFRVVLTTGRADGFLTVAPQPAGILEKLELVATAGARPLDLPAMLEAGRRLLDAGAQLVTASYRPGTASRLAPHPPAGPLLPGLVVARADRFPGLTEQHLRAVAPPATLGHQGGWVLPFPVPSGTPEAGRLAVLRSWSATLRVLQQHDRLAVAVASQQY